MESGEFNNILFGTNTQSNVSGVSRAPTLCEHKNKLCNEQKSDIILVFGPAPDSWYHVIFVCLCAVGQRTGTTWPDMYCVWSSTRWRKRRGKTRASRFVQRFSQAIVTQPSGEWKLLRSNSTEQIWTHFRSVCCDDIGITAVLAQLSRALCVYLYLSLFLSHFFQRTNSDTQRMVYYCICRWTWCQCSWSLQISIVVVTIWSACHDNAAEGIVRWPSSDIKCTHAHSPHPGTLVQLHHQHSADKFFRLRLNLSMWRNNDASPPNKFPFMPLFRRSLRPITA